MKENIHIANIVYTLCFIVKILCNSGDCAQINRDKYVFSILDWWKYKNIVLGYKTISIRTLEEELRLVRMKWKESLTA